MKIYFIRHGETTGDVEDRYGGAYDDPLTEKGKEQSQRLGGELRHSGIEKIISSPLVRARETAEILAKELGCPVEIKQDLKERDQYGILTGMIKKEAQEKYPDVVEKVKDRLHLLPGTESYADFRNRVTRAFNEIINSSGQTVAVVWHGGPMRALFRDILKEGEIPGLLADCGWTLVSCESGVCKIEDKNHLL